MSLPRPIHPGSFYMLTRRCTLRRFLLRPDPRTNQTFLYCLAEAAQRFGIDVIGTCVMSNHHHTLVYDRHGRINELTEHLHKLVAKAMNALRGRFENFWASEPPCLVRLIEPGDVMNKLVYALTNPIKDGLVESVHHWPGVNSLVALLNDQTLTIERPSHFFRDDGTMPDAVTLRFVIPTELGDPNEFRRCLRERVARVEQDLAEERRRTGKRVLGRRAVLKQSWRDAPGRREPRGGLRPRIAAASKWARIEALLRDRAFLDAYRAARDRWRLGIETIFPSGTYWLRRFAHVRVATPVTS